MMVRWSPIAAYAVYIVGFCTHSGAGQIQPNPTDITIGFLQDSAQMIPRTVINSLESGNHSDNDINLYFVSPEATNSQISLLRYVSSLECKGTLSLIVSTPCDHDVIKLLPLARVPIILLNGNPFCFSQILTYADVIYKPPFWAVHEVMSKVLKDIYEQVLFIHDGQKEKHVTSIMNTLKGRLESAGTISSLSVNRDTMTYVISSTGLSKTATYMYNTLHVVWMSVNLTVDLLREVNQNISLSSPLGALSHWLVICTEPSCLEEVSSTLPDLKLLINQLAVLTLQNYTGSTPDKHLKNVVDTIRRAANESMRQGQPIYKYTNTTDQCQTTNRGFMEDYLLPALKQTSKSKRCYFYEVYATDVTTEPPSLQPMGLCKSGAKLKRNLEIFPGSNTGLDGRHFVVTTIESAPFVLSEEVNGTLQFFGMAIDMLMELSQALNFTYSLSRVPDSQFGGIGSDGNWTGMVGQLQRKEVDMSIASLSVTDARDTVMDFVEYYFEYGAGIMKKPDEDEHKWRVILQPFKWPVWLSIVLSVPFAGVMAWVITVLVHKTVHQNKDEFVKPGKSAWYTFGAILSQGSSYLPKSASGRTFLCHWWAFSIIIVASYGGSLIAYLTLAKTEVPFNDLEGMVSQNRYKWGFREGTVYHTAFKQATGGIFKKIWDGTQGFAKQDSSILTKSSTEQLEKVQEGNYVFMMDRTPLLVKVISDKACDLVLMAETFMPLPFGIGLQEGSPYQQIMYRGVKRLQQSGLIKFWEKKWWPKQSCSGIPIPEAHAVTLMDTQSAFYLLLAGVVLASVVLFFEQAKHIAKEFRGHKPVRKPQQNGHTRHMNGFANHPDSVGNGAVVANTKC